jgi:hypothetical protein
MYVYDTELASLSFFQPYHCDQASAYNFHPAPWLKLSDHSELTSYGHTWPVHHFMDERFISVCAPPTRIPHNFALENTAPESGPPPDRSLLV